MNRLPSFVVLLGLILWSSTAGAQDDAVKTKLEAAKATFKQEMIKLNAKPVGEWFDKREEAARKTGNKKLVDEIKAERVAFNERGDLPKTAPPDMRKKVTAVRTAMESAYDAAVKEYTRGKKDAEATAVEKEFADFKDGLLNDGRRKWAYDGGVFTLVKRGAWEEVCADKNKYTFKELARTDAYVEIDRTDGFMRVRLYNDRSEGARGPTYAEFRTVYNGKWVK